MRNNIVHGGPNTRIGVFVNGAIDFKIYNNTIWDNWPSGSIAFRTSGSYSNTRLTQNGRIFNNILRYPSPVREGQGIIDTIIFSNNTSTATRAMFADRDNGDYRLAPTDTRAAGRGMNLYSEGVTTDFAGNPRPATGAFDIGAMQSSGR
jgi:hypothetical protein